MTLPQDLLDILVCSLCKSDLKVEGETLRCQNAKCAIVFSIKEGIPVMLIDEASRPCPKCQAQRDLKEDELRCPKCGETFRYERK